MLRRVLLLSWLLALSGCSSIPPAARPAVVAAGAVAGASLLFYVGEKHDSSDPPENVGCFDKIENGQVQRICPP